MVRAHPIAYMYRPLSCQQREFTSSRAAWLYERAQTKSCIGLEAINAIGREIEARISVGHNVRKKPPGNRGQREAEMAVAEGEEGIGMFL